MDPLSRADAIKLLEAEVAAMEIRLEVALAGRTESQKKLERVLNELQTERDKHIAVLQALRVAEAVNDAQAKKIEQLLTCSRRAFHLARCQRMKSVRLKPKRISWL